MGKYNFTLIIPSLDPDEKLTSTVNAAIEAGIDDIILVDDGSAEDHRHFFTELESAHPEVTLLRHEQNCGKGTALKTAFSYFLENRDGRDGVVTADGDGQHRTEDIIACAEKIAKELDGGKRAVVLGCRNFKLEGVPAKSRFGNHATSLVFRIFCGMKISDTQTGLRAIPTEHIGAMLEVSGSRYEYETNMLLLMGQHGIPYNEIEISTIYYDDNRASHFRPLVDSIRVYGLILKYIASSLVASFVDLLVFYLLGQFIFKGGSHLDVLFATAGARVTSCTVNFLANRNLVFKSRTGITQTLLRYICLAVPVMLASWLSVYLLSDLLYSVTGAANGLHQLGRTALKIPVDIILFLISFRIQRKWVFAEKNNKMSRPA